MWKAIYDSVQGTSHRANGLPCQDACRVHVRNSYPNSLLVAVCADGAGSASHADLGAHTACDSFIQALEEGNLEQVNCATEAEQAVREIIVHVRTELEVISIKEQIELRDLACTFLAAV